MPDGGGKAVVELEVEVLLSIAVDEMELGVALGMTRGRVDVKPSLLLA